MLAETQLRHGVWMPRIGLGTTHAGGYSHESVLHALQSCGYRLIDTARRYGNEEALGSAIIESGVAREDIFLTSKLWPTDYGFMSTIEAFTLSRKRLGSDYLDLYLMHWPLCPSWVPDPGRQLEDTWRAMEQLFDSGRLRAIGVSNFSEDDVEKLLETASVVPHVNQFEFHPYLAGAESLRVYCLENRIQPMGSCPLAKGGILDRPEVLDLAKRVGKTPAQVCIRYSVQNDVITIPKSLKPRRLAENIDVFDWALTEGDMALLRSVPPPEVRCVSRDTIQPKIDDLTTPDGYKLFQQSGAITVTGLMAAHCDKSQYASCHSKLALGPNKSLRVIPQVNFS